MVDLSSAQSGELGQTTFFSDLFASAVRERFTGGILVHTDKAHAIFFRDGSPVHVGGPGFESHFVGELLVREGTCAQSALVSALDAQAAADAANRPLLGAILMRDHGVEKDALDRSMRVQTLARAYALFSLTEAKWQAAPGENARIRDIGIPTGGLEILMDGLRKGAADTELRRAAEELLGQALQLDGSLPEELQLSEDEKRVLKYLDKPRKPDQLERATSRRAVRIVLRLMTIFRVMRTCPASKAIPIPKASLVKSVPTSGAPVSPTAAPPPRPPEAQDDGGNKREAAPRRASPAGPSEAEKAAKAERALLDEVRALHKELGKKTHFEILDVKQDAPNAEIKKNFHTYAKRYHPDAFSSKLDEESAQVVREVSARVNEAWNVLGNEKSRAEYIALLNDERIKGDARKKDKLRDAEVKHQMAVVMLRKRDYQKAREYFAYAMETDPENPEYKASMAWAMFADPKFDRAEAMTKAHELLTDALKAKRPSPSTFYYMGQVLKAKNQNEAALENFKKAAALDPKHTDAAREVRLLEMRARDPEKAEGGGLSKLFKRG